MFEKIEIFDKRYSELSQRLYEPSVAADPEQYQKTMKELKSIEEIVLTYREYKQAVKSQDESIEILEESGDSDLKELAQLELDEAKGSIFSARSRAWRSRRRRVGTVQCGAFQNVQYVCREKGL